MSIRTRFAPSPTGKLHLGHALAARVAHTLAKSHGGTFLLRHEDIDGARVKEEYYGGIEEDLKWLGFIWDESPIRQTGRISKYDTALDTLRDLGLVYPCFCTRKEIRDEWARMGAAPQGPEGPIYPGICRELSPAVREQKLNAGVPCAWRLDTCKAAKIAGSLTFQDLHAGITTANPEMLGDVVLSRKDIGTAYHLAVVVDDAEQNITHVTRGEDLFNSTHIHRLLQHLLKIPTPVYFHHSLVVDEKGERLAKRCDSKSIASFRSEGLSASDILAMMDDVYLPCLPYLQSSL